MSVLYVTFEIEGLESDMCPQEVAEELARELTERPDLDIALSSWEVVE